MPHPGYASSIRGVIAEVINDVKVVFPDDDAEMPAEYVINPNSSCTACQRDVTYRAHELEIPPKADPSPPKINEEYIGGCARREGVCP